MPNSQINMSGPQAPRAGRGGPNRGGLAVSASLPYFQKVINLLGYHAYCWNVANVCLTGLAQLPALGYRVWITEFNCLSCALAEFQRLLSAIGLSPLVDRFAAYTNRQPCGPPDNCGWVLPGADLVNANGTLTANGQAYHDWQKRSLYLPMVSKPPQGYP